MGKLDMGVHAHHSCKGRMDTGGDIDRLCRDMVSVGTERESVGGGEGEKGIREMTNLIGAALVILSVNIQTNMGKIAVSCEEMGCTNFVMVNGEKYACHSHTKEVPFALTETITVGCYGKELVDYVYAVVESSDGAITPLHDSRWQATVAIPLYEIITVKRLRDEWMWVSGLQYLKEGTWFRRIEK